MLEAFGQLGFRFRSADNERGRLHGVAQQLPFFQEIEFAPPMQYANRIKEVELTFVADPQGLNIVLEADNRGGFFTPSRDTYGRWYVSHQDAMQRDWAAEINNWLMSRR